MQRHAVRSARSSSSTVPRGLTTATSRRASIVRAFGGHSHGGSSASTPAATPAPAAEQVAAAVPEAVTDAQAVYAPYQQQPGVAPQYYQAVPPGPPGPPMYPAAYAPPPAAATGANAVPWWVWMAAGIVVAKVMDFVQNLVKKGPQAMMAEMAMKQMMKGMNMPPGAAPGASPFGAAAGGAPNFGPYGAANPFAPGFKPPVDTTATPVSDAKKDDASRGEKFAARAAGTTASAAAAPAAASDKKDDAKAATANGMPVVEAAEVKEPAGSSSSSGAGASSSGASTSGSSTSSGSGSGGGGASSFFSDAAGAGAGAGGAAGTADVGQMTAMMEQMLRDPNMQKMLYPYLPEPMRNPDSIEWMLNTPEVRKQLENTLAQSGMSMNPQMMQMMQQMDFSQEKVQQQFSELGLKPEDVISKVLENPELASGFANPKVQAAIFDISQNPMNVMKYQEDPEIMKVLEKVTELFSPAMKQGAGAGTKP